MNSLSQRAASKADAPALARLVDIAGEGIPRFIWADMAEPGQSIWDIGTGRAAREEGAFSYRNAMVVEEGDTVIAAMVGYPLAEEPEPVDIKTLPPILRPLQQLEEKAPGTWYLNVLATLPEHRGKGHGKRLIEAARAKAREAGQSRLSLILQDANPAARLYWREGFRAIARRPIITEGAWRSPGQDWLLMVADV